MADVLQIGNIGPSDARVPTAKNFEAAADPFEDFWTLYPRREGKKNARKAWEPIPERLHVLILVAAFDWRRIWARQGRESHTTPMPATWLNGERWDDELPADYKPPKTAAHADAVVPEAIKRGEIPEHVKAMLAKLRAK